MRKRTTWHITPLLIHTAFGTSATKMSAFTANERTFVFGVGEANIQDLEACCRLTTRLERAVREEEFELVEWFLAALLNCRLAPSNLAALCRSDLGALVAQLHRRPITAETSFVVRLSTLLVITWAELLKVVSLTTTPKATYMRPLN
jgi:hypothetical protein